MTVENSCEILHFFRSCFLGVPELDILGYTYPLAELDNEKSRETGVVEIIQCIICRPTKSLHVHLVPLL